MRSPQHSHFWNPSGPCSISSYMRLAWRRTFPLPRPLPKKEAATGVRIGHEKL